MWKKVIRTKDGNIDGMCGMITGFDFRKKKFILRVDHMWKVRKI